jgi:hypothetical protein
MPLNFSPEQSEKFGSLRARWFEVVQPFDGYRPSHFLEPIPEFSPDHLDGARILVNREAVMDYLPKEGIVAEVGTQEGIFAKKLYDRLQPHELHLFDIDFSPFRKLLAFGDLPATVTLHEGDSSTKLATLPDAYFDVIYVDGDHSYEGVKRDTEVAKRKLKKDGVLWFNDFTLWSPVEMIDYGVPHVISELCHSGEWKIDFLALHPLFYHDVVLTRRI